MQTYPVHLTSMSTNEKGYGLVSEDSSDNPFDTPEKIAEFVIGSYNNCKTTHNTRNCDISFNCPLDIITPSEDIYKVRNLNPDERARFEKALQKALSGK